MVSESATGHGGVLQITERTILDGYINSALDLCREADQRIAQLTTDLAQCTESAPLELVGLLEELIDWIVGANSAPADPQLVVRAQATIERWKV
jgi:hypothetical protein